MTTNNVQPGQEPNIFDHVSDAQAKEPNIFDHVSSPSTPEPNIFDHVSDKPEDSSDSAAPSNSGSWRDAEAQMAPGVTVNAGTATDSLIRGVRNVGGLGMNLAGIGRHIVGDEEGAKRTLDRAREFNEETEAKYPAKIKTYKDILVEGDPVQTIANAGTYVKEGVLEQAPMMIGPQAGGALAVKLATPAMEVAAKKAAVGLVGKAARDAAAKAAGAIATRAAAKGAIIPAIALNTGETAGNVYQDTGEVRPGLSLATGAVKGALDILPDIPIIKSIFKPEIAAKVTRGLVARLGVTGVKQWLSEGGTEILQNEADRLASHYVDPESPIYGDGALQEDIDTFLKVGAASGAMGMGGEVIGTARDKIDRKIRLTKAQELRKKILLQRGQRDEAAKIDLENANDAMRLMYSKGIDAGLTHEQAVELINSDDPETTFASLVSANQDAERIASENAERIDTEAAGRGMEAAQLAYPDVTNQLLDHRFNIYLSAGYDRATAIRMVQEDQLTDPALQSASLTEQPLSTPDAVPASPQAASSTDSGGAGVVSIAPAILRAAGVQDATGAGAQVVAEQVKAHIEQGAPIDAQAIADATGQPVDVGALADAIHEAKQTIFPPEPANQPSTEPRAQNIALAEAEAGSQSEDIMPVTDGDIQKQRDILKGQRIEHQEKMESFIQSKREMLNGAIKLAREKWEGALSSVQKRPGNKQAARAELKASEILQSLQRELRDHEAFSIAAMERYAAPTQPPGAQRIKEKVRAKKEKSAAESSMKVGDRIPWKNSPDPNEDVKEIEVVKLTPSVVTVRWVGGSDLQNIPRAAVEERIKETLSARRQKDAATQSPAVAEAVSVPEGESPSREGAIESAGDTSLPQPTGAGQLPEQASRTGVPNAGAEAGLSKSKEQSESLQRQQRITVLMDKKPVGTVKTFQEASLKMGVIREKAFSDGMESDEIPLMELADEAGKVIGHVALNGRVFEGPARYNTLKHHPKLLYEVPNHPFKVELTEEAKAAQPEHAGAERGQEIWPYSKDMEITNLDQLPRGTGARYLEVVRGEGGSYVAKQWRNKPVVGAVLIDFKADAESAPVEESASKEPLFSDTYKGPRYTYGMRYRPLDIGAQPKGWIIDSKGPATERFRFGTIQYPRQLTADEIKSYELEEVNNETEGRLIGKTGDKLSPLEKATDVGSSPTQPSHIDDIQVGDEVLVQNPSSPSKPYRSVVRAIRQLHDDVEPMAEINNLFDKEIRVPISSLMLHKKSVQRRNQESAIRIREQDEKQRNTSYREAAPTNAEQLRAKVQGKPTFEQKPIPDDGYNGETTTGGVTVNSIARMNESISQLGDRIGYVEVVRDIGKGRSVREAYDLSGKKIADGVGVTDISGKLSRRKGIYWNVVNAHYRIQRDQAFSFDWLKSEMRKYDKQTRDNLEEHEQREKAEAKVKVKETPSGDTTVSVPSADKPGLPMKEQKKYLLAEIDKAIEGAPVSFDRPFVDADADEARLSEEYYKKRAPGGGDYNEDESASAIADLFTKYSVSNKDRFGDEASFEERVGNLSQAIHSARELQVFEASPKVTIEVPGDGTFSLLNSKRIITEFREKIAKKFPTTTPKADTPKTVSGNATAIPAVAKRPEGVKGDKWRKLLEPFVSTDQTRGPITKVYHAGKSKEMVATDGRRLVVATGIVGPEDKVDYPSWRQVIPGGRDGKMPDLSGMKKTIEVKDTEKLMRRLAQSEVATEHDRNTNNTVDLFEMPDGSLAIASRFDGESRSKEEGFWGAEYQSDEVNKGKRIASVNGEYLSEIIGFMRRTGNESVKMSFTDELTPIVITGAKEFAVLMPIRGAADPESYSARPKQETLIEAPESVKPASSPADKAIELYGTPEKAIAKLTDQIKQLREGRSATPEEIVEYEKTVDELKKRAPAPQTPLSALKEKIGKNSRGQAQEETAPGLTRSEFEDMIQRHFATVRDYYSDEGIHSWRDYLEKVDPEVIGIEVDSNFEAHQRYLKHLPDEGDSAYTTVEKMVVAYKSNKLPTSREAKKGTEPIQRRAIPENGPIGAVAEPVKHEPMKPGQAVKTWEVANTRPSKTNKAAIAVARQSIFMDYSAHGDTPERIGITRSELNKKLRSWGNVSASGIETERRMNANAPLEQQWVGITRSSWLSDSKVTANDVDAHVRSIEAPESSGWNTPNGEQLRNYILRAFNAIDTRILYKDLSFLVESTLKPNGLFQASGKDGLPLITIRANSPHTVAHEVGHYLDRKWAREAYGHTAVPATTLMDSLSKNVIADATSKERQQWHNRFHEFVMDISKRSDIGSEYMQDRGEVFARFVSKFVDWTNEQAGKRSWGDQRYSNDKFSESDYHRFIQLLQEKAYVDEVDGNPMAETKPEPKDAGIEVAQETPKTRPTDKGVAMFMSPELDNAGGKEYEAAYDNRTGQTGSGRNPADATLSRPENRGRSLSSDGERFQRGLEDLRSEVNSRPGSRLNLFSLQHLEVDHELAETDAFKQAETLAKSIGAELIPTKGTHPNAWHIGFIHGLKIVVNSARLRGISVLQFVRHEIGHAVFRDPKSAIRKMATLIDENSPAFKSYSEAQYRRYEKSYLRALRESGEIKTGSDELSAKIAARRDIGAKMREEFVCEVAAVGMDGNRIGVSLTGGFGKNAAEARRLLDEHNRFLMDHVAKAGIADEASFMSPEDDAKTDAERQLLEILGIHEHGAAQGKEEAKASYMSKLDTLKKQIKARQEEAKAKQAEKINEVRTKIGAAPAPTPKTEAGVTSMAVKAGELKATASIGDMLKEYDGGEAAQKIAEGRMSLRAAVNKLMKANAREQAKARLDLINAINFKLPDMESRRIRQFLMKLTRANITDKAMERALSKIDAMAEAEQKRNLVKAIKVVYGKATESMGVNVAYRQKIKELMDGFLFSKPAEETLAKARELADFLEQERNSGSGMDLTLNKQMAKLLRTLIGTPLRDMPTANLEDLFAQIYRLATIGKLYQQGKEAYYKAQQNADLASLIGSTPIEDRMKIEPTTIGGDIGRVDAFRNMLGATSDAMKRWYVYHQPMDVVFDLLDGAKHYAGANYRLFKSRIDLAFSAFRGSMHPLENELADKIKELGIGKSESERVGAYAIDRQATGRQKLLNTLSDGTEADDARVNKMLDELVLTDNEKAFYDWMRGKLDAIRPAIERVMKEVYNAEMDQVEHYFPFITDWNLMESARDMYGLEQDETGAWVKTKAGEGGLKKNVAQGFTKARRGAGKQAVKFDAIRAFHKHMQDVNYYVHVGPTVKYLQEIANRPEYATAVGNIGQRIVREYLDTMARQGGMGGSHILRWVDAIRNNIGVGTLGFRLSSILIQPSSFFDGAGLIGGRWAFKGALNATSKEWHQFIQNNMTEIKDRVGDDWAFGEANLKSTIAQYGFLPLQWLDERTAESIAAGAYEKNLHERGLAVDFSNPDPEALAYAQKMVRRTQASPSYKDQPLAVSRGALMGGSRTLARAIYQFQTFSMNKFSFMAHDGLYSAIKNKEPMAGVVIMAWTALAFAMEEMIRAGLRAGPGGSGDDQEPEDIAKAFLMDYLQIVPWFGSAVSALQYNQFPAPVVKTISDTATGLKSMLTAKSPEAQERGAARFAGGIGSMAGIPGSSQAAQWARNSIKSNPEEVTQRINDSAKRLSRDTGRGEVLRQGLQLRRQLINDGLLDPKSGSPGQFSRRYEDAWKRLKDR